jgi:hypothetical protein
VALALACAGMLVGTPSSLAKGRFSRTLASGHVDFQRQVAVARGVGPRAAEGDPDRAVEAARTNLKALLLPHPVDGEVTLGDLAAYHPDLATALEFQLVAAREARRSALPPDLEEVVLELDLAELVQVLLPFLGSDDAQATGPLQPADSPPKRVLLRLSSELAADHVPSLLPSLRGLGGVEAIPARGAWLREAYREPLVRYRGSEVEVEEGDWEVTVVATGGLAGATLFVQDADAERVRRLLAGEEIPTVLVVPGESSSPLPVEEAPELAALAPSGSRELPPRYREPVEVRASAPLREPRADEETAQLDSLLSDLRARLSEAQRPELAPVRPATPEEAISAVIEEQDGRMPPEVLEALPESAFLDDGRLYGAAETAAVPAPTAAAPEPVATPGPPAEAARARVTWQEFDPGNPDGTLWESFDSSLDQR